MRVLTIDGMSSAALQIRLIKSYEEACPGFLRSIDCFAGASDGGYTALYLATHITDDDAANLAMCDEAIAFSNELARLFQITLGGALKFATGWSALIDLESFTAVFDEHFGATTTLGDVERKLVILSFGAFSWKPYMFTNLEAHGRSTIPRRGGDATTLTDVATATSAMPMALPMFGKGLDRVVDGGMATCNVSMITVSEICASVASVSGGDPSDVLRDLKVLSLGAQEAFKERAKIDNVPTTWPARAVWNRNNWGYKQWFVFRPFLMLQMVLQGAINLAHAETGGLMPNTRYHRIQPPLEGLADTFKLALCSDAFIASLDAAAEDLVNDKAWFDAQMTWIRDCYLADD